MDSIKKIVNKYDKLLKYFVMACIIVCLELIVFQIVETVTNNYKIPQHALVATFVSFVFAVILNWIGGRKFIFNKSKLNTKHEFILVLIASCFGLIIQSIVVFTSIEFFRLLPVIGKCFAILFSFFWNYWFRAKIIYKNN